MVHDVIFGLVVRVMIRKAVEDNLRVGYFLKRDIKRRAAERPPRSERGENLNVVRIDARRDKRFIFVQHIGEKESLVVLAHDLEILELASNLRSAEIALDDAFTIGYLKRLIDDAGHLRLTLKLAQFGDRDVARRDAVFEDGRAPDRIELGDVSDKH